MWRSMLSPRFDRDCSDVRNPLEISVRNSTKNREASAAILGQILYIAVCFLTLQMLQNASFPVLTRLEDKLKNSPEEVSDKKREDVCLCLIFPRSSAV